MTETPPVSVIIVNHTRRDELTLTLKAFEYQRYRNFELIVVSDIEPGLRPPFPINVRWIHFDQRNISAARNLGLAAANGALIAFCDDDAQPDFNWLEALVPAFDKAEVGAAGGYVRGRNGVSFQSRTVLFDRAGRDIGQLHQTEVEIHPARAEQIVKTVGTNAMFRRAVFEEIGGFDEAFRFFLDEADINLRLSDAGWMTAMVPRAEVYHGFAAGPYRTGHRVPLDLFEIGASQAVFSRNHWRGPMDPVARDQRREQLDRLHHLHLLGLVSGGQMTHLMDRYDAGRAEGAARASKAPAIASAQGAVSGQPTRDAKRLVVSGRRRAGRDLDAKAALLAADGHEVTVIVEDLPWRPLGVCFVRRGFFRHRFGLFGKAERDRERPMPVFEARVQAERRRIAGTRGDQIQV